MGRRGESASGDGTVRVRLNYSVDTGEPPVDTVKAPGEGRGERTGVVFDPHDVTIRDARPLAAGFDLDREGVVLLEHSTAVKNFYDDSEVVPVYYPEVEAIVKAATGADKVVVFDHTIRIDDELKQAALKARAPVRNMHNDFAEISAPRRVRDLLPPDEAEARLKKRYGSINVWRSIAGPAQTRPLVVCDARSIDDARDWIALERHYPDRVGVTLNLRYNPTTAGTTSRASTKTRRCCSRITIPGPTARRASPLTAPSTTPTPDPMQRRARVSRFGP